MFMMQTSSSYFNDKLIKVIADEIEDTIRMIVEIEITKAQVETLEGRCESLRTEDRIQVISLNSFAFEYYTHVMPNPLAKLFSYLVFFRKKL